MKLHLPKMLLSAVLAVVTGTSMAVADQMSKPAFGGTEWTYSTEDGLFHKADGTTSANPGRADGKGPVLIFDNVGTVSASASGDTSDAGGIKVTGNSIVTSNLRSYAGAIEVGEGATLNASYGGWLKNTEADGVANVWVDGTLTFAGHPESGIVISDGNNFQNWHIGTEGLINFGCADFVTGGRTLNLEVIVDTIGGVDGLVNRTKTTGTQSRTIATLTDGGNIFETLNSNCTIYDTAGTALTDATLVNNGTSVTVSYTGSKYEAQTLYTTTDVLWTANGTEENTLFSDVDGNQTSFVNGDSVWVTAGGSVTAQTDVVANELVLYSGSLIVNGQRVSASTLSLSGTSKLDLSAAGSFLNVSTVTLDSDTVLELKGNWNLGTLTTDAKTFTKTGDGTLTLTNTGNFSGGTVNINEGTLEVNRGSAAAGVLQNTTVNVAAGATFKSSGHDALGWAGGHTAKIVLTGEAGKYATFLNNEDGTGSNTLMTDIVMNGHAKVTGTKINTYGGTITASGTDNVFDSELQFRNAVTMTVNEGGELTLAGKLNNDQSSSGTNRITKAGAGTLIVSSTDYSSYNAASGGWNINAGTLQVAQNAGVGVVGVTVASGATLDVASGGHVGNALNLSDGSTLKLTTSGLVLDNGSLTLGTGLTLNISTGDEMLLSALGLDDSYSYTLASGVSSITGDWTEKAASDYFSSIMVGDTTLSLDNAWLYYDSTAQTLTLASVPEPTTATLSLLALGALALRRRRA